MRVVWGLVFDDSILHLHESIYERFFSHFGIRSAARRIGRAIGIADRTRPVRFSVPGSYSYTEKQHARCVAARGSRDDTAHASAAAPETDESCRASINVSEPPKLTRRRPMFERARAYACLIT